MDGVKSPVGGASKQQLKSSNAGKSLDGARKQAASPVDGQNRKQQPPKAWQGPNPITQRANSSMSNGTEKPLPKLPPQAQAKSNGDSHAEKHAHDRLLYIIANFTGQDATLTLKNGEQFTGVFSGGTFDSPSKNQYVLKMVKRTRLPSHQQINGNTEMPDDYTGDGEDHVMTFDVQDTVDLAVKDVVTASAPPTQNGSISSLFRTDTEISRREAPMARERELQRWDAGGDAGLGMSLEDSGDAGWDQFAANERMYGIQSDYDENIYTTAIDRNNPLYKQREAQAARLAREIEGSAPANAHVAEERRRDADKGDGLDEEEKYSGVRRESHSALPKRGAGSYIPPSQRPITSTPSVHGAPFDPAIISTTKPIPSPAPPQVPNAAPEKAAEPVIAAPFVKESPEPSASEIASRETSVPPAPATQLPKKPTEQTPENHIRNTVDAFKEFANSEKLKARQAQEAKRSSVKAEKNVRLNDLKKFALNFTLKTRVPDDLVPILAKDREKQAEIQKKAEEAAKEAETKAIERKKQQQQQEKATATGATPPAPTGPAAQSPVAPGTDSRTDPRLPFNQHPRNRISQNVRGQSILPQGQSPRVPLSQRLAQNQAMYGRGGIPPPQPLPADLRIPSGPAAPAAERTPLSPTSSTGLNVKAFEFRPAANNFTPSGTTPSPQRTTAALEAPAAEASASFFGKDKKPVDPKDRKDIESTFNPVKRMLEEEHPEEHKKSIAANGGIPQPYRTPPTWNVAPEMASVSYKDSFPKAPIVTSHEPSPLHTPNPNGAGANANSQMPHAHQLPVHMQGPPHPQQMQGTPQQQARPPFYAQASHHGQAPGFDPRMQQFGPGGSVQSSPRFLPANPAAAFGGHMQMPQFAGQPIPGGYGMSPSMGYRQPAHAQQMMQGAPMGMGMGMGMPGQHGGQMPQMRGQGFPQGPQYGGPPMGGQMMVPNPSGGYVNGPTPQQQSFSPMPPHAQPHMPAHMQQGHGGAPGGYGGSPRPPMMQHQGSQHGFQPPMHPGMQQQGAPNMGGFAPSQGQPHPYHYQQQRHLSGSGQQGFPPGGQMAQMTPRQGQVVPQHASPGMGVGAQGDEGK